MRPSNAPEILTGANILIRLRDPVNLKKIFHLGHAHQSALKIYNDSADDCDAYYHYDY